MERENTGVVVQLQQPKELIGGETREAREDNIDIETFRVLAIFQDKCIGFDSWFTRIEILKQHADRIKKMGPIFETLGLARHVKGAELAWRPRERLKEITGNRVLLRKYPARFDNVDEMCVARTNAYFEIASECENIVSAFGLDRELKDNRAIIRRVRELISSTSEERLAARGFRPMVAGSMVRR